MFVTERFGVGLFLLSVSFATVAQQAVPKCKVDPFPRARKGETVLVKMHVVKDSSACSFLSQVGAAKANGVSIFAMPKHGTLVVDGDHVLYTPAPGFSGTDDFLVEWSAPPPSMREPRASLRTQVEVNVRATP